MFKKIVNKKIFEKKIEKIWYKKIQQKKIDGKKWKKLIEEGFRLKPSRTRDLRLVMFANWTMN